MLVWITLLMQQSRGQTAEAMAGHAPFVAHSLKPFEDGVVAHGALGTSLARKDPFGAAGEIVQSLEYLDGLSCERHDVRGAHLHALRGNVPAASGKVELRPLRTDEFTRANERQRQ